MKPQLNRAILDRLPKQKNDEDKNVSQRDVDGNDTKKKDLLDFHLDKACASLVEAGKGVNNSYLLTLLFIGLTAIFISGEGTDSVVAVPILGIDLSRWHAAEVTLLLSCSSFYSLWTMKTTERLLSFKIDELIAQRYGQEGFHWHIYYPSIFTSSELVELVSRYSVSIPSLPAIASLGLIFASIGCGYIIGSHFNWNLQSVVALILSGTMLVLAIIELANLPLSKTPRKDILKRIEG